MHYTLYDVATGRIKGVYQAPDFEGFAPNVGPGDGWREGAIDPALSYIAASKPVPFPPSPGEWAVWDWDSHAWTDPRDAIWIAAQLSEAQASALDRITAMRGRARLTYITDIPGQEAIYIAKLEEARAWIAAADPNIADYPLIGSEIGVTAPTAYEVAQIFLNLNALWVQVAAVIDGACFAAEIAVQTATSADSVETIVTALAVQLWGAS